MEKEKMISDLQEDLRKLCIENETRSALLDKDLVKRKETEKSTAKIATYCNDLKFKFENIVETVGSIFKKYFRCKCLKIL